MAAVLFVSEDAGLMVTMIDGLESAGHTTLWKAYKDGDPRNHAQPPDVVVFDGDVTGVNVVDYIKRWRQVDPAPAIVLVGGGAAPKLSRDFGLLYAEKPLDAHALGPVLARAAQGRFVGALTPGAALRALGKTPSGDPRQDALIVAAGSANVDMALVRDALRPYADHYVTVGPMLAFIREHRALSIPETNLAMTLDGSRTLRRVAETGGIDPQAALRCVWALASMAVARLSAEPPDDSAYPAARYLARVRRRLSARGQRVAKARTHFDILEILPDPDTNPADVEIAARHLWCWYAPERLAGLDLGGLAQFVEPYWQWVHKAVTTLRDPATCRRYFYWLIEQGIHVDQALEQGRAAHLEAEQLFAQGQQALATGEGFRAVSQLAQAARWEPEEPDYEAYAGWARYMAEVERGNDGRPALARELAQLEASLYGRRPRARALYVMGLMAQVAGDLETARLHFTDALTCDPQLSAAQRALGRMGRATTTLVTTPST